MLNKRIFILKLAIYTIFSIFIFRIGYLQIYQHEHYKAKSMRNSHIVIKINALRGKILDRNNKILVQSYVKFTIKFQGNKEELEFIKSALKDYEFIQTEKELTCKHLEWSDLSKIFENNSLPLPEIETEQIRKYFYNESIAHLIGYIQSPSIKEHIGIVGIEKSQNEKLKGADGKKTFLINAKRKILKKEEEIQPQQAAPIVLSIDIDLQEKAYKALEQREQGSMIIANIKTGEIIVATSFPSFDPHDFTKKNMQQLAKYYKDEKKPLFNSLLQGSFSPASTIKPFILIALLKNNIPTTFECKKTFQFNKYTKIHCWKEHGKITIQELLPKSCSYGLYELSNYLNQKILINTWQEFGLSEPILTDINAKHSKFAKKKLKKIDILFYQIGQTFVVTLAQLTRAYARLASNKKVDFTIFKQKEHAPFPSLNLNTKNLKMIHKSLYDTLNLKGATGYGLYKNIKAAGKTGTSQVKKIKAGDHGKGNKYKEWHDKDHAIFCAFLPYDDPQFVGCVIINHGGGGRSAISLLLKILDLTIQKHGKLV